jgi:nucleoside-diphosphate-sugar epimerase
MNIVIGKNSNLSIALTKTIDDVVLFSAREIIKNIDLLKEYKKYQINIILNNFYPSHMLNKLGSEVDYLTSSVEVTRLVLEYFDQKKISKVIYSSSASVYGNQSNKCCESDPPDPLTLYASLKLENETFIKEYCNNALIDFTIARNFNFFGGADKFSIIYKLMQSKKNNSKIILNNNGSAVRDFIHIDDAARIYSKLLRTKGVHLVNIGTGNGNSVGDLIHYLQLNGISIEYTNKDESEIKYSVANISLLEKTIGKYKFKNVSCFLLSELSK